MRKALPDDPPASAPSSATDSIGIRIAPDDIWVLLYPASEGALGSERAERLGRVHTNSPGADRANALQVALTAPEENTPQRITLTITGEAGSGWQSSWYRWSYSVRLVPDLFGGDAVSNQDLLSDDRRTLTLLLLPGETRHASLEFVTVLDGHSHPGDYFFTVSATIEGDETPACSTIGLLRLRHPRPTYLDFLPAVYEESLTLSESSYDGQSLAAAPFFERYLSGLEQSQTPLRVLMDNLHRLYDPDDTPADFLPWLANWLALSLDETWPELKRRRLIREGARLYQWRGTRRGLSDFLKIYTGVVPQIEDQPFQGMRLGPATRLGDPGAQLGNILPHTFVVILPVPDTTQVSEEVVRRIIESQAPAHTTYQLRIIAA